MESTNTNIKNKPADISDNTFKANGVRIVEDAPTVTPIIFHQHLKQLITDY